MVTTESRLCRMLEAIMHNIGMVTEDCFILYILLDIGL
jgi:hypothetical protein